MGRKLSIFYIFYRKMFGIFSFSMLLGGLLSQPWLIEFITFLQTRRVLNSNIVKLGESSYKGINGVVCRKTAYTGFLQYKSANFVAKLTFCRIKQKKPRKLGSLIKLWVESILFLKMKYLSRYIKIYRKNCIFCNEPNIS